jgi:hypothetical protein
MRPAIRVMIKRRELNFLGRKLKCGTAGPPMMHARKY